MTGERDLTAEERAIIDFVIRHGMRSGRDAALAQLAVARHAGVSHEGEDVCFEIGTPDGVPPIEGSSSPIGLAVRPNDEILWGEIDLWLAGGRLAGIELSLIRRDQGPNAPWPPLDQIIVSDSQPDT